jgi:hypothetical protein
MSQSDVDLKLGTLELLESQLWFRVLWPLSHGDNAFAQARHSLKGLGRQTQSNWQQWLVRNDEGEGAVECAPVRLFLVHRGAT